MRVFWSVVALLAAIGVWFVLGSDREPRRPATQAPQPDAPSQDARSAANEAPAPSHAQTGPPAAAAAIEPQVSGIAPETDLLGEALAEGLFAPPVGTTARTPIAVDTRSPADITRRIDARTLELDGRFRIIGTGSPDDPYRISWELLTSAGPFIDPIQQALTPPPWVRAVDGTYVEISAYYSTAVRVASTKNVLLTFNRWDGCCIGLPPTPFDAIDTTLATPLDMKGLHLFRFGTFRGRLVVEPFAAGTFLLGLYRLEDASFVTQ